LERAASPLTYVGPGDPPFLIIQGTNDPDIPPHHSLELARRLTEAGVPNTLVMVQGAAHGLTTPGQRPGPDALTNRAVDFLAEQLGAFATL